MISTGGLTETAYIYTGAAGSAEAKAFASNTTDGWAVSTATGGCYHNGKRVDWSWPSPSTCPEFNEGDTVGVLVDLSTKMLSVYLDVRLRNLAMHITPDDYLNDCSAQQGQCVAALFDQSLTGPVCFMCELCMGPHHPQTQDSGEAYTEGTVRVKWVRARSAFFVFDFVLSFS